MGELPIEPALRARSGRDLGRLLAGAVSFCALVALVLIVSVELYTRSWPGEDGFFLTPTSTRLWTERGVETAALLVLAVGSLLTLRRTHRGGRLPHRGVSYVLAVIAAPFLASALFAAAAAPAERWLADSPMPAVAVFHYPAPAVARLLFTPDASDLPSGSRAVALSTCAREAGATVAGREVGLLGPLLVVERATLFLTAARAGTFYAAMSCSGNEAAGAVRRTPVTPPRVSGVAAARADLDDEDGTALHGVKNVELTMRIRNAVVTAYLGNLASTSVAPTPAQISQVERMLAAAAGA